jgi:hypothetical protein
MKGIMPKNKEGEDFLKKGNIKEAIFCEKI